MLVSGPPEPQLLTLPFPLALLLILIGDYGPALAAIIVVFVLARGRGLRVLFLQVGRWRFNPILYIVALFLTFTINLVTVALFIGLGTRLQGQLIVPPTLFRIGALIFGPVGEELGFRGFAQPTLQRRYSRLVSSLIVGVAWFVWQQWPLFAPAAANGVDLFALAVTFVYLLATSIFFGWLYNITKGSVLIVLVAHAGLDLQKSIAPDLLSSGIPYAISTLFLCAVAFVIVLSWRSSLKRGPGGFERPSMTSSQFDRLVEINIRKD